MDRGATLGLSMFRCGPKGDLIGDAVGSQLLLAWLNSSAIKSQVEQAVRGIVPAGCAATVELSRGCWLIVLPQNKNRRCTGWIAAMALLKEFVENDCFAEACRLADVNAEQLQTGLGPILRNSRAEVDHLLATLRWMNADLERMDQDQQTLEQFSEKLSQAYEETNMLFNLARMMNGRTDARDLMQTVCRQLHTTLPFKWVAIRFGFGAGEVMELAGELVLAGKLPCPRQAFDQCVPMLLESLGKNDRATLLKPSSDLMAALMQAEVVANPIRHDNRVIGALLAGNKYTDDPDVSSFETKMLDAAAAFLGLFHESLARFTEQRSLFMGTLQALIAAIDAKDAYTCGHSERVALLASQMAATIELSPDEQERYHVAGIVHDMGKIGVPESVLGKPTRLTDAEFELIKRHPRIGYDILKDIPALRPMLPGVLHHHERWDGLGYPEGLAGENIPLIARVLALADAFDAMSSNRAYRPAMPREQVLAEVRRVSGTQFDPALVQHFVALDFHAYDGMLDNHRLVLRQAG